MFYEPKYVDERPQSGREDEGVELTDEELEHVVGGLQRLWTDGAASRGTVPEPEREAVFGGASPV